MRETNSIMGYRVSAAILVSIAGHTALAFGIENLMLPAQQPAPESVTIRMISLRDTPGPRETPAVGSAPPTPTAPVTPIAPVEQAPAPLNVLPLPSGTGVADVRDLTDVGDVPETLGADDDLDPVRASEKIGAWASHTRRQRAQLQLSDLEFARALALARAKSKLAREETLHTFSLADLPPPARPEKPGPRKTVFDSPSFGRAGLSERTALGQTVLWVSDECYVTSGRSNLFAFPAGADIYNMATTRCVGTKPRDDLFKHLRRDH
jgi:hypothetical protein